MVTRLPTGTVNGRPVRSRTVAGLVLTESAFPAGCVVPRHAHESAFFRVILSGSSTDTSPRLVSAGGPGSVVFHPADEQHSNVWHRAGRGFLVEFGPCWLEGVGGRASAARRGAEFPGGPAADLAVKVYREFRTPDGASGLAVEGLALELLAAVARVGSGPESGLPRWLRSARDLLHDRFRDGLGLGELAAEVGVHPGHLARAFRRHFRATPGEYLRRLRVEHAAALLAGTDRPILEVALDAGFADQSHFTTAFRRQTGLTPLAYRRALAR